MKNISLNQIFVPSSKIITRFIEDDLIIVPIESDTIDFDHSLYSLTNTGKDIWKRLNKNTSVEKLCSDLAKQYEAPFETIVKDVLDLLEDLLEKGLIAQTKK